MKQLLNVTVVVTALLSTHIVSAAPKACPTWDDMLASLDNKLRKAQFSELMNYFGKGGHKWAKLAEFAQIQFSGENPDFMVAVRAYKDDYASFSNTQKRRLAGEIVTDFVSGGQQVNLDGPDREAIEHAWHDLGPTGVPTETLFDRAYEHISRLVRDDTFRKYIKDKKDRGVCQ